MPEVVEGVSLGETAAVQPVADIAAVAVAVDIAAVAADIAAVGTADAVALVDIVVADIAAALVVVVVVVVGYGTPLAADFELFLLPPPAASASAVG